MNDSNHKSAGKKPKLVRDSFTIPKAEYAAIEALKGRALTLGVAVKKSELLRAGLMLLQPLSDARFKAAMASVPTIKTGRPAASIQVDIPVTPTVLKKYAGRPAPVKPVVKKAAPKKAAVQVAPPTIAVKARATTKPTALPPATPTAKTVVQPAKKVAAKKATVTKA